MYLKSLRKNFAALNEFQNGTLRLDENIVELFRQKRSLSSKRKLSILLNFPFPFVSWNGKLWSWKLLHGVNHSWFDSFSVMFYTLLKHAFQPIRVCVISELCYNLRRWVLTCLQLLLLALQTTNISNLYQCVMLFVAINAYHAWRRLWLISGQEYFVFDNFK